MKQLKIKALFFSAVILCISSCLKKGAANIDIEDTTAPIVELQYIEGGSGSTINSGMQYFSGGALTYPSSHAADTAHFNVNIAGPAAASSDVNVTLGVKASAVLDNYKSDSIKYELMPDSLYHIITPTATIKAGSRIGKLEIAFFPSKLDPSKSYMLPIVVEQAGGLTVSGNFGIVYFHVIGNPLAGAYDVVGTRYNYTGSIGYTGGPIPPNYVGTAASPSPKVAAPSSATLVSLDFANLGGNGYHYLITYHESNPNTIEVSGDFLASVSNFVVLVKTYDPVLKKMHIVSTYNNAADGSGNDRIIDETFTHK